LSTSWSMDTTSPTSTITPLPQATTNPRFLVSATGSDPLGSGGSPASGIASFALFVSTDGGPFALLATVPASSPSALFAGQVGHTYSFYSVATDNAGNTQPTPASAQATVQVITPLAVASISPVTPDPRNTPVLAINVTLSAMADPQGFDFHALSLTRNGGPNLVDAATTVTPITATGYLIGGLGGETAAGGTTSLASRAYYPQHPSSQPPRRSA